MTKTNRRKDRYTNGNFGYWAGSESGLKLGAIIMVVERSGNMTKFDPVFDSTESAILLAMYEEENGHYDSYSLTWKLNTGVTIGSSEAEEAFKRTRVATENLIERGFVRGERQKGADGVYFKELKLTPEGERTTISHRKEVERFNKELPKFVEKAAAVAVEIADYEKKNPPQS